MTGRHYDESKEPRKRVAVAVSPLMPHLQISAIIRHSDLATSVGDAASGKSDVVVIQAMELRVPTARTPAMNNASSCV